MNNLAEFFRKKRADTELSVEQINEIKADWLLTLKTFFDLIVKWLEPAAKEGLEIKEQRIIISEEIIGQYSIPSLELSFLERLVYIRPVARFVVGALGRVDIIHPSGSIVLLYYGQDKGWYVSSKGYPTEEQLLTEDKFSAIIQEVFS